MENKTVNELREIAKERSIKYYYKMRREELLNALIQRQIGRPAPAPAPAPNTSVRIVPSTRVRIVPSTRVRIVSRPVPALRLTLASLGLHLLKDLFLLHVLLR